MSTELAGINDYKLKLGARKEQMLLINIYTHKDLIDAFVAGFICAGGNKIEAESQAEQSIQRLTATTS